MAISQTQRADIGQRYLTEINRRIETRTARKAAIKDPLRPDSPEVVRQAVAEVKSLGFAFPGCVASGIDENNYGSNPTYDLEFTNSMELAGISQKKMPKTRALLAKDPKAAELKQKLCNELELLHKMKSGSNVGAFQSYISRLWSPGSQSELMGRPSFMGHLDAFLDSKRGFTCDL